MMEFTEQMIEKVAMDVCSTTEIKVGDKEISLKAPFARVTMRDSILHFLRKDIAGKSEEELFDICADLKIPTDPSMGKGKLIDEIFGEKCEGNYIQPTFITDYPIEMSPLLQASQRKPRINGAF